MFCPGETVSHGFTVPFAPSEITDVYVTYRQGDHILLQKHITSGFEPITGLSTNGENEILGSAFVVVLTQQESLLFSEGTYDAQVNVLAGDSRFTSAEMRGEVGKQHIMAVI